MPYLFGKHFTREELMRRVGHLSQIGGISIMEAADGPARGVRYLEFRTGSGFQFKVAVDRGMDVAYCDYRGQSLAWIPSTGLPAPWYFGQDSAFGWLRTALGGLNNSCGMIHIGNPETADVSHYHFPARAQETYGVHDRMALLPGQLVSSSESWEGDECTLEAVGRVVQAQAYGENLVLTRGYRARLGESRFTMHDTVENAGWLPTEHMLLYHINAGFPAVDEGSEQIAPVLEPPAIPEGLPASASDEYSRFIAPQKDWQLQGFELKMGAEADGSVPVAIVNRDHFGIYVVYNQRQMPQYLEWRMMGEGQYAVGIEPCTNTFGRETARRLGQLIVLQPGEKREYDLEVGVLEGAAAVEDFRARVARIRAAY
ncbi:MAG: DUF4432 family protein [Anaerolineae bacterium]|nr:DUF4432 family protein [Anaerolineae bacterium]